VDTLAKQASSSCFIGPKSSLGIRVSTIYSSISSWAFREQNRLWHPWVIWLQTGKVLSASTWPFTSALCSELCEEGFEDPRWTSYWPRGPQSASLYYGNPSGFWLSPLSRGRWYNCTSYRLMQCFNASSERYPCKSLLFHWIRCEISIGFSSWGLPKLQRGSIDLEVLSGMRTGPVLWPQRWCLPIRHPPRRWGKVR